MADTPYLDKTGLSEFWTAIKTYISSHGGGSVTGVKGDSESSYRTGNVNITKANLGLGNVENKSSATIRGELTKSNVTIALGYTPPTSDTNTTYSLTQDATDGHKITLTPSSGTAQTVTIPDNNTWRGIQNNLTSDSTTDSLSAAQGKALANGSARDSTKLPLAGGTMTGSLNTANNVWNKIGDDVQIGDINEAGTLGIQGLNANTGIRFTTYNQTTKTTGGKILWDGSKFNIGGYTLEKSVPSNAVFTDTTYSTMSSSEIKTGTATTQRVMTAANLKSGLLDLFYPVGSYYETSDANFNPNTSWGGTWSLETAGQVHVSAGTGYTIGATGGEATHVLTPAETAMKNHSHTIDHGHGFSGQGSYDNGWHSHSVYRDNGAPAGSGRWVASGSSNTYTTTGAGTHSHSLYGGGVNDMSGSSGGQTESNGSAHNNMQPYIVVNRWHRTA